MAVMVKMVNKQSIFMPGVRTIPRNQLTAPVTGMNARSNSIIKSYSMDKNPTTFQSKWVVRHFLLPIAFRVAKWLPCFSGSIAFHSLVMKVAITTFYVLALTTWNITLFLIRVMFNVAVMLQPPGMHLAKSLSSATFFAAFHRTILWGIIKLTSARIIAKLRGVRIIPFNSFLVPTISTSDDFCPDYISHERPLSMSIIPYFIAREPGFYNATFCAHCRTHFPLDQFVWEGTNEQVGS